MTTPTPTDQPPTPTLAPADPQPRSTAAFASTPPARRWTESPTPGRLTWGQSLLGAVVAALTAVQGILVVAANAPLWVGDWPSSSAALDAATQWGTCIAAAAAAWLVAAPRRHRYQLLVHASSRAQTRIYLTGLLSIGLGNLAGYLIVLGYIVYTTAPAATHGHLNAIELLTPLAAVPMAIGIGAIIGRFIHAKLAPIPAAITPFAVYVLFNYAQEYTRQTVFTDILTEDQGIREYARVPVELLVSRSVFWMAIGVALVCWMARANRTAYVSTVAAGIAASLALLTAGVGIDTPQQYAVVCLDGAPRVCVDRAHDHLLTEYRDRVDADLALIPGLDLSAFTIVPHLELFPFARKFTGHAPMAGPQVVVSLINGNTGDSHVIDPGAFDANVGYGLFVTPCWTALIGMDDSQIQAVVNSPEQKNGVNTATVLYDWWMELRQLPADGSLYAGAFNVQIAFASDPGLLDAAKRFEALSNTDRAAWFTKNQDAIMHCRATLP